jgi:hypothetical protein
MKSMIAVVFAVMMTSNAVAAIKCVPDGRGGMCCWDTSKQGPFKPLSC